MGVIADFFKKIIPADKLAEMEKEITDIETELTKKPEEKKPEETPTTKPAVIPNTKPTEEGTKTPIIEEMRVMMESMLAPMTKRLDEQEGAAKARAEAELKAKVAAALKEHVGVRWPETRKAELEKLLTENYDGALAILSTVPANPSVNRDLATKDKTKGTDTKAEADPEKVYENSVDAAKNAIAAMISVPGATTA